jgi:hypothetical protein
MNIKAKVFIYFFLASLIPLLVIGLISYEKAKDALERRETAALEEIANVSVKRIQQYFGERKADIRTAQNSFNIKTNLPISDRLLKNPKSPEYIWARDMLDGQLKTFQEVNGYDDVMLVNTSGKIVYATNSEHREADLGHMLPDPDNKAFREGKHGIYISKPYVSERRASRPNLLVTAPIQGFSS